MIEIDARHEAYDVDDVDMGSLLGFVAEDRVRDLKAGRRQLRQAYRLAVLNPPTPDHPAATLGDQAFIASDCEDNLAGDGTPDVALFAVEHYSAAAGLSRPSALALVADTLDLHHRLPHLWSKVEALDVPAWRARRVALLTRKLSLEAARWFDAQVHASGRTGFPTISKWLAYATAKFHPEQVVDPDAPVGKDDWRVTLHHPNTGREEGSAGIGGTSELIAVGDSLDLQRFYDLVCAEAERLRLEGDTDTLDQRRAKAIGRLVEDCSGRDDSQQTALDLTSTDADAATLETTADADAPSPRPMLGGGDRRASRRRGLRVMVHVSLTDLLGLAEGQGAIASTDRLGEVLVPQLRDWLSRHGSLATVAPVIDMHRTDAVDRHDPSEQMSNQVRMRDQHCVFPDCYRSAWDCDLDHIEPYQSPDDGGPPGQTGPDNLAPLCRRHHLAKTAGRWRYQRNRDGTYTWTSAYGRTHLVTPYGSIDLTETA